MPSHIEPLEDRKMMAADPSNGTSLSLASHSPQANLVTERTIRNGQKTVQRFTFTWTSPNGIDTRTLDNRDLRVRTAYGDTLPVKLRSIIGHRGDTSVTAVYSVRAPDGKWGSEDNGRYTFLVRSAQVRDMTGAAATAGEAGTFNVRAQRGHATLRADFDVMLQWNNWAMPVEVPQEVRSTIDRPVWFTPQHFGFWDYARHAAVGDGAGGVRVDQVKLAMNYAQQHDATLVIDLEVFWPGQEGASPWWWGGVGQPTQGKIQHARERANQAIQFMDAILAHKPDGLKVTAYLPNGHFWGGTGYKQVIIDNFVEPISTRLDYLLVDSYAHPNDVSGEHYGNRLRNLFADYHTLNKPLYSIVWMTGFQGQIMNDDYRQHYLDALADRDIRGTVLWDHATAWSAPMARLVNHFAQFDNASRDAISSLTVVDPISLRPPSPAPRHTPNTDRSTDSFRLNPAFNSKQSDRISDQILKLAA